MKSSLLQSNMICQAGELAFSLLLQPVNSTRHSDDFVFLSRVGYAIGISVFTEVFE